MPRRAWFGLLALVVWTVFVWGNRLFNTWTSDTETTTGRVVSTVLAGGLIALAAGGAVVAARTRHRRMAAGQARLLQVFAAATVVVWVVRIPQILLAGHSIGFAVVHAALGVVSIALAVGVWRSATAARSRAGEVGTPATV